MKPRGSRASVIAAILVAVSRPAAAPGQETGDRAAPSATEVTAVAFDGAESVDSALLREALATRPSTCRSPLFVVACFLGDWEWAEDRRWLDPAEVERDRERIEVVYETWGYPDARVDAVYDTADATVVRFRVREGEPLVVESLELRDLDAVDPPIRRPPRLPLEPGQPYALPHLAAIEAWLRDEMARRGHPFGVVSIDGDVDEAARTARLEVGLEPGPAATFGSPRIDAVAPIEADVVRAALRFRPGEPYVLDRLYETERVLYDLPIVRRAVLQPALDAPPAGDTVAVPVDVRVVPRKRRGVEAEGTISSTECLTLAGHWRDRYFLGGPRLFGIGAGVTHLGASALDGGFPCTSTGSGPYAEPQHFVDATLIQPWSGHPGTRLELGLSSTRSASPGVYVLRSHGASVGVSRAFTAALTGALRYQPAYHTLDASAAYFCGGYGVCDESGILALEDGRWFAPLEATVAWTPTEPGQTVPPAELEAATLWGPLPWRPWLRAGLEAGGGWSGSDWSFVRGLAEAAATRPMGVRSEVAGRVRAGFTAGSGALPPFVRLYAGGLYSVRGFAQNLLGPAVLVASADRAAELGCEPACPPSSRSPDPAGVSVRPTGGDGLLEASIEARRWLGDIVQVAAFVDAAAIHRDPLVLDPAGPAALAGGWTVRASPGVGVRLLSNLGPIRFDIGYDPSGPRPLPLFATGDDGALDFRGRVRYDPFGHDGPSWLTETLRRLQVHIGIGQPF